MKKVCLILLTLLISVNMAMAEGVTISTCPWEPYVGENLSQKGFTSEIVKTTLERAGYTPAAIKIMPWNRALAMTEKAKYDGIYPAFYSKERAEKFFFSDPFAESVNALCTIKGSQVNWDGNIKSLKGMKIGVVAGYANSPEFDAATFFTKDPCKDDLTNLKKLLKGRVDAIVIDKYNGIQLIKTSPVLEGGLEKITFLKPDLIKQGLYFMISKTHPEGKALIEKFNKALAQMKTDGTIKDIMFRHGMNK